jgi:ubiquinone/menaquinone biosynthesis C-methylase UbiE
MNSRSTDAAPDFDGLARAYRCMEWASFGPFLGLCRAAFLSRLTRCHCALVLGDGDGRFTARLFRENSSIRVHAVDASSAMLTALRRNCGADAARLTTERADLRTWHPPPASHYDLIVAHFVLDCLNTQEVLALAQRIKPVVAAKVFCVISEFAVPLGWFGRLVAGPIVRGLYISFGLLTGLRPRTLPDYAAALTAAGFTQLERRPRLGGLLVSELWTVAKPSSDQSLG